MILNLDKHVQEYRSRLEKVEVYLTKRRVRRDLRDLVRQHFRSAFEDRAVDDETILAQMPRTLRVEVMRDMNFQCMNRCWIFSRCEPTRLCVKTMCSVLRRTTFLPGEVIVKEGDLVREMFFLDKGFVVQEAPKKDGVSHTGSKNNSRNASYLRLHHADEGVPPHGERLQLQGRLAAAVVQQGLALHHAAARRRRRRRRPRSPGGRRGARRLAGGDAGGHPRRRRAQPRRERRRPGGGGGSSSAAVAAAKATEEGSGARRRFRCAAPAAIRSRRRPPTTTPHSASAWAEARRCAGPGTSQEGAAARKQHSPRRTPPPPDGERRSSLRPPPPASAQLIRKFGAPLCEVAFLFNTRQPYELVARSKVSCLALLRDDFNSLMSEFKEDLARVRETVTEVHRQDLTAAMHLEAVQRQRKRTAVTDLLYALRRRARRTNAALLLEGGESGVLLGATSTDYDGRRRPLRAPPPRSSSP